MPKTNYLTQDKGNTKLAKGIGSEYLTVGLFLSPHKANSRGVNLCPYASESCVSACLNTAGLASVFPRILEARRKKTDLFLSDRSAFLASIKEELAFYKRRAVKRGLKLVVRLNGTSDIRFPSHMYEDSEIQHYDYTKDPGKMSKFLCGNLPSNYHLTFSYSGENLTESLNVLRAGGNVAVVFSSDSFPSTWQGFPVVSGESSDLRFLDPQGHVIALKAKGKARKEVSSFIIQIERREKANV